MTPFCYYFLLAKLSMTLKNLSENNYNFKEESLKISEITFTEVRKTNFKNGSFDIGRIQTNGY